MSEYGILNPIVNQYIETEDGNLYYTLLLRKEVVDFGHNDFVEVWKMYCLPVQKNGRPSFQPVKIFDARSQSNVSKNSILPKWHYMGLNNRGHLVKIE